MNQSEQARLDAIEENIELVTDTSITELPFEFFSKPGNRTTKLLAVASDSKPVEGRHRVV